MYTYRKKLKLIEKNANIIPVELSYIDLVLRFHDNWLINEKVKSLAIFGVKTQDGRHFHGNTGVRNKIREKCKIWPYTNLHSKNQLSTTCNKKMAYV